jgi:hypothetical protein
VDVDARVKKNLKLLNKVNSEIQNLYTLEASVGNAEPHFFYMYANVVEALNIWFSLPHFEIAMLKAMNVAPSQLHPSS